MKLTSRQSLKTLIIIAVFVCSLINTHAQKQATPFKNVVAITTQSSVKLEVTFNEAPASDMKFNVQIAGNGQDNVFNGEVLPSSRNGNKLVFYIKGLSARQWTPADPRLYQLTFTANTGMGKLEQIKRIGFRFFESKNGNLYLNGKPIFLRGIAINPPARGIPDSIEKSKKFAEEYVRFMKSINVNIIRIPNNENWYDVCDELGMMVFGGNYGSTVDDEKPPKNYEKAVEWYKNEAYAMIASHPSLMVYAMTNEVPYEGEIGVQWEKFLSYAHKQLVTWDSTRQYIANAGYGYGKSGDICDLHRYWGWYYCSPFNFLNIRDNNKIIPFKKPVQPITFTECVGNYTGPDGRYNLTPDHKNPGSQLNWTGHADWSEQARLADEHQSFTLKQATELFRRLRVTNSELSGVFPFTILFYNWNNVQQFVDMGPKPVTKQVRLSYQPVLVSWENWKSQVYAGTTIDPIVHIVNDDNGFSDLRDAKLIYQLRDDGQILVSSDTLDLPTIAYYATWQKQVRIKIPAQVQAGNYQLVGRVIRDGKTVTENFDKIYIGSTDVFSTVNSTTQKLMVYDITGKTTAALDKLQVGYQKTKDLKNIPAGTLLLIAENSADEVMVRQATALRQFVKNGGRILSLRQDKDHLPLLNKILSAELKNITTVLDVPAYPPPVRPSRDGYYVNPERPDHPVFYGVKREQLRVWSDYTGWNESKEGFPAIQPVTDGFVPVEKKDIERIAVLANYGVALEGIVVAEITEGKGSVMVCGLDLAGRSQLDPIADKMLINLVSYMANGKQHDPYPLITAPIVWGDYATEKGILTGVNSGLMVHAVPLIPANNKSKLSVTREGNRFLGGGSGFNTRPGVQYVAHGRRIYGPYYLRGFGNVPEPIDTLGNVGNGFFWCSIPAGKKLSSTIVWNQSDLSLTVKVKINDQAIVSKEIKAGETTSIEAPVNSTTIKMEFQGDRRLVLLQTSFR